MRRVAWIYSALQVTALAISGLHFLKWLEARQAGLDAFPGSPDWISIYANIMQLEALLNGLFVGLAMGAITLIVVLSRSPQVIESAAPRRALAVLSTLSIVLLFVKILAGSFA